MFIRGEMHERNEILLDVVQVEEDHTRERVKSGKLLKIATRKLVGKRVFIFLEKLRSESFAKVYTNEMKSFSQRFFQSLHSKRFESQRSNTSYALHASPAKTSRASPNPLRNLNAYTSNLECTLSNQPDDASSTLFHDTYLRSISVNTILRG